MHQSVAILALIAAVAAGCNSDDDTDSAGPTAVPASSTAATAAPAATGDTPAATSGEQRFPDVIDVEATASDDGTWSFAVTMSSPYDTPDRYADGWRVLGPDGAVYGEHMLMHDHASEQPFTRTQRGVEIPPGVDEVTIEGRDQQYGYGGATVTITLVR